jgi:uncharacterized membrane protein HdeD (DUF308 family)
MSKRKRATKPGGDDANDDEAAKDDMVHVTSDLLSASPDIFAGKKSERGGSEPMASPVEPTEASTTLTPAASTEQAPPREPPAEPVTHAPAAMTAAAPARRRPTGSSVAIGIVLVVIGVFALGVALTGVDLRENGWPLFIIIPGLALLVAGFLTLGAVATVPGGVVTMLGVVLGYSNATGDWPAWAYAWTLVIPFGIGLGVYLQALRDRDRYGVRTGRTLLFVGLMMFLIGFVIFESILGISGRDYFGPLGKAALPVLLIIVGAILLVRSWQRSRSA